MGELHEYTIHRRSETRRYFYKCGTVRASSFREALRQHLAAHIGNSRLETYIVCCGDALHIFHAEAEPKLIDVTESA